ncbi:hypothetical protein GCM10010912_52470 [Paenibacillus albidus]|uniref:Copper amine oxidase-like N-terminal domain-containing protein n=1 Tax=Paenibacillus albidus TaxID=2041023 RepID=A0A917CXA5_9BACL|nr:stalk domain-containing protein [Paenibacillus albidus]GGG01148.1 hypothetical protein GCM10010912_52470 [Paenibacillus albidus]
MGKTRIIRGLHTLLALMLILSILPATRVQASENMELQLGLKVGSTRALINGAEIQIDKPFVENGAVMVPLGVFKKTFGSTVSLEKDKVVKVMYGSHTGAMTIGSMTAWKDGIKVQLQAPPRMVSGVLMVPLRFVAGVLGARVSPGDSGGLLVSLTPPRTVDQTAGEPGIEGDAGKTRIGNSYYKWSMNYPTEFIVGNSGGDESIATFMSVDGLYYLEVRAVQQEIPLGADELLEQLIGEAEEGGEMVMDREVYPQAAVPYARIVSQESSGTFWESRKYYADDRVYEVYLTDDTATNYKDLGQYTKLLDSFKPSFDNKDNKLRDLSTVKNGLKTAADNDYGVSLQVPAGWSTDAKHLYYEGGEEGYLGIKVTSAPAGSTLDSWTQELNSKARDSYVPDALLIKGSKPVQISGEPGQVNEVHKNTGKGWLAEYQALLLKDGYRYYVEYVTPAGQEDSSRLADILSSITIDFDWVQENFGKLETDDYAALSRSTVTKNSRTFGFAVDIPRLWTPYQDVFETQNVEYRFTGGWFQIFSIEGGSVENSVNSLKSFYQNKNNDPNGPKIVSEEATTFAGQPATMLTVHQSKKGVAQQVKQIVVGKDEMTYTITVTLNDVNATIRQQEAIDQTLQSFRFTGE